VTCNLTKPACKFLQKVTNIQYANIITTNQIILSKLTTAALVAHEPVNFE